MPYLVELVIRFPIDWHSNLETLIFDKFSPKIMMKNTKIGHYIKKKLFVWTRNWYRLKHSEKLHKSQTTNKN